MELTSTRDDRLRCGGYEAIFRGIAPDGGLYVPAALALHWHRRKLKVEHNLARKVRRIDSRDTRCLFVWHG